jgi:acetylornithine deacetylase
MERYREETDGWVLSPRCLPSSFCFIQKTGCMNDVFALTRSLVDIESVSGNEMQVTAFLFAALSDLAARHGGSVEKMPVEGERCNLFASWSDPIVTLSTHIDTVPPFIASSEDSEFIWGRGSCDAKGIAAAMIAAVTNLLCSGIRNIGLLFLVGEERNSAGAKAALRPRGSRFIINGEPTENKLALASKGALRLEVSTTGRTAHSGYPELGESAIEKLLDTLQAIRRIQLPSNGPLGSNTVNIGTLRGGRAPNVIADSALAEVFVRFVDDPQPIYDLIFAAAAVAGAEIKEVGRIPAMHFEPFDGLPTTIVSFTSDASILSPIWGQPLLIGPGSIRVAHTEEERISKHELVAAIEIYEEVTRELLRAAAPFAAKPWDAGGTVNLK